MKSSLLSIGALSLLTSGCAVSEALNRHASSDVMADVHIYTHEEDRASNPIDRALATCFEQTERSETVCVGEALSRSAIGPRALAAMIPQCRLGSICTYDHTTRRRLGLFASYATVVVKDWRVSFDLRDPASSVAAVPVTVTDRNVFVVLPAAAPKGMPTSTPGL